MAIELCNHVVRNENELFYGRKHNNEEARNTISEKLNTEESISEKDGSSVSKNIINTIKSAFSTFSIKVFDKNIKKLFNYGKTMSYDEEKSYLIKSIVEILSKFHEGTPIHKYFINGFIDTYIRHNIPSLTKEEQINSNVTKRRYIDVDEEQIDVSIIDSLKVSQLRNILKNLTDLTRNAKKSGLKSVFKKEFWMPENKGKLDPSGSFFSFWRAISRSIDKQQRTSVVYLDGSHHNNKNLNLKDITGFREISNDEIETFDSYDIINKDGVAIPVTKFEKGGIVGSYRNSVLSGKKTLALITKDNKVYTLTPDDSFIPSLKEFIQKHNDIVELRFYDNKDTYKVDKENGKLIHKWESVLNKNNLPTESFINPNHVKKERRDKILNANFRINGDVYISKFLESIFKYQDTSKQFYSSMQNKMNNTYNESINLLNKLKKIKNINSDVLNFIESTLEREIDNEVNQNNSTKETYVPNDYAFGNFLSTMISRVNDESLPESIRQSAVDAVNTYTNIQKGETDLVQAKLVMQARVKHFKQITGIMDRNLLNTNDIIWENMVNSVSRDVHRNEMSVAFLKSLLNVYQQAENTTNDKVDLEHAEMTATEMIELFKTAIGYPDYLTEGRQIHDALSAVSNVFIPTKIKPNPAKIEQMTRMINSYVSSGLLWQPITATRNLFQDMMKTIRFGAEQIHDAHELMKDKEEFKLIYQAAKEGGVISQIDYMADVIKKMVPSRDDIDAIRNAKALARAYRDEIEKTGKDKLSKKEYKEILQRLTLTQVVEGWDKDKFRKLNLSALANWAFNDKYGLPSMVKTEETARLTSFVIGVLSHSRLDSSWKLKYKSPFQSPECVKTGIAIMEKIDFSLSQQSLPKIMHGVKGNFFTKLKSWQMKRMSYDMNVFLEAFNAVDIEFYKKIEGESGTEKGKMISIMKMISAMFNADLRKENPEIAHLRRFALIAGTITLAQEAMLYIPFIGRYYSKIKNIPSFMMMSGGASPFLEACLFVSTRLPLFLFDDDEEFDDDEILGLLKFSPIGVVPMSGLLLGFGVLSKFIDIDKDDKDHWEENYFRQSVSPFVFGGLGAEIIDYGVNELGWKE